MVADPPRTRGILIAAAIGMLLAAIIAVDAPVALRAPAAAMLGLVLPGLLLSWAVFPVQAPDGSRLVLILAGSLVISIFVALFVAGVFGMSRSAAAGTWAAATLVLTAAALLRHRNPGSH
jgi:hypothetical protein